MFRNNSEEIALLQARLRLTAEHLKKVNDNRFITFANNAELSSSSSHAQPNVLQDISNNPTIRARGNKANRSNTFRTAVEAKLNSLAHKYVTKTNKRK